MDGTAAAGGGERGAPHDSGLGHRLTGSWTLAVRAALPQQSELARPPSHHTPYLSDKVWQTSGRESALYTLNIHRVTLHCFLTALPQLDEPTGFEQAVSEQPRLLGNMS